MPALAQTVVTSPASTGPSLRIWTPHDEVIGPTAQHGIGNPVRQKTRKKTEAPGQKHIWDIAPLDPAIAAAAEIESQKHAAKILTAQQREWLRSNLTVRRFYADWIEPEKRKGLENATISRETLSKDRSAISVWEKYTRPAQWSAELAWPGYPLGKICSPLFSEFVSRARCSGLASGSLHPLICHLGTILRAGQKVGLIDPMEISNVVVARSEAMTYSDQQIGSVFNALANETELQVAFVLSLAIGARPRDLFGLRWTNFRFDDRPLVRFVAHKTGVHHSIPLGPVVLRHLQRLPRETDVLFPHLVNSQSTDPERSEPARRRNDRFRTVLFNHGICELDSDQKEIAIDKPWQVCRSTAGTKIERVGRGMSSVLLGHSGDRDAPANVTQVHYLPTEMEPSPDFVEAVNRVAWPKELIGVV